MKKIIATVLALLLVLSLAACGGEDQGAALEITLGATEPPQNAAAALPALKFVYEGVELIPGEPFDAAALPEADSLYTVPSCAVEGTDNVYSYGSFEVTAFDQGQGEHIYSIYFLDDTVATPEGLKIGDSVQTAIDLYGTEYQDNDGEYVYQNGDIMLSLLLEGDVISAIEIVMVTE